MEYGQSKIDKHLLCLVYGMILKINASKNIPGKAGDV